MRTTRKPRSPGFGAKAAVLSVDNYRAAIGDERLPLLDSITLWPNSTGLAGWEALDHIAVLLPAARAAGIPVIHMTGLPVETSGVPGWSAARAARGDRGTGAAGATGATGAAGATSTDAAARDRHRRRYDIVEQAAPLPGEVVLAKSAPSAFFGTPLLPYLLGAGIDTLIVVGESVSGCVRASVVDGCSYRLRMIVVEECVYDRHQATRAMNLFDIDQKYGDVISFAEAMQWITAQGHEHTTHQSARTVGPPNQADLPLPQVLACQLPPGARPTSVSEHPIPGHVIRHAGGEVLDAAAAAMAAGFATAPHVIAVLSEQELHPSDDRRYAAALALTDGGAIVVGAGYRPTTEGVSAHGVEPGACPECGSTAATVASYIEPNDTPGQRTGAVLFSCVECGTEWDLPVSQ